MRVQPPKQLIGRAQNYDVYSVSAFAVRNLEEEDEEFGLYSHELDIPGLIPAGEIWLAEEGEAEWSIFLAGALAWLWTGDYNEGLKAERLARGGLRNGPITDALYLRHIKSIRDPVDNIIDAWFVDGKIVRDNWKTDFVEGGHHYVYPWIPKNEIWIADAKETEWPALLTHEYLETRLMRDRSMPYEEAHSKADDVEYEFRKKHYGQHVQQYSGNTRPEFYNHASSIT